MTWHNVGKVSYKHFIYSTHLLQSLLPTRNWKLFASSPPKLLFNNKWALYLERFSMPCPSPRGHGARRHSKVKWVYRAATRTQFSKMQANISAFFAILRLQNVSNLGNKCTCPTSVSQYLRISTRRPTGAAGGRHRLMYSCQVSHGRSPTSTSVLLKWKYSEGVSITQW